MKNNKLAVNFLASIVTYGTTALINFFLSPYIVATAGEAAYGFVSLATAFTTYASIISTAINSMSGRFVMVASVQNKQKEANQYYVSTLFADSFLGVIFLILGTIMVSSLERILNIPMELIKDVKVLFALVFISFIVNTFGSIFDICYFITNKLYISSIRTIITALIRAVVIVALFVSLPVHIYYMGIGTLVVAVLTVGYNAYKSKQLLPFVHYSRKQFKFSAVKEIASAGIWNSINSLGTTLTEGLDLLICNVFLTPDLMGVMSLSKTIPVMLKAIMTTVVGIFGPEIVNRYAQGDREGMKQYLNQSTRIMRLTLCVPFGIFIGLGYAFYTLWLPDVGAKMLQSLSVLAILTTIFSVGVSPIYNVFTAANKMKVPSITHVIGGTVSTCIVLVLLKTTSLGVYAVAGVSSIVDIIKTLTVILPFAAKLIGEKYDYFWSNSFKSALTSLAVAVPGLVLTKLVVINSWVQLIVIGVIYAILAYTVVVGFGVSKQERKMIKNKFFQLLKR